MNVKDEIELCKKSPDEIKRRYNFDNNGLFSYYAFLRFKPYGAIIKCKDKQGAIGFIKTESGELIVEEQLWKVKDVK